MIVAVGFKSRPILVEEIIKIIKRKKVVQKK